jgi:hypothetical protein
MGLSREERIDRLSHSSGVRSVSSAGRRVLLGALARRIAGAAPQRRDGETVRPPSSLDANLSLPAAAVAATMNARARARARATSLSGRRARLVSTTRSRRPSATRDARRRSVLKGETMHFEYICQAVSRAPLGVFLSAVGKAPPHPLCRVVLFVTFLVSSGCRGGKRAVAVGVSLFGETRVAPFVARHCALSLDAARTARRFATTAAPVVTSSTNDHQRRRR